MFSLSQMFSKMFSLSQMFCSQPQMFSLRPDVLLTSSLSDSLPQLTFSRIPERVLSPARDFHFIYTILYYRLFI